MDNKQTILKSRAASYLNTSMVVLPEEEYQRYLVHVIDYHYPKLQITNPAVYAALTFQGAVPLGLDPLEWWLTVPVGPESCSRDIGDVRAIWSIGRGDEWGYDVESYLLAYQQTWGLPHQVTGYACAETIRRGRLSR